MDVFLDIKIFDIRIMIFLINLNYHLKIKIKKLYIIF